ncbi:MAG: hypothetical protein RSG23_09425 [Gordonibacter sp.]|uniref:hypothetical protein n=1 Tax=Gordonibacter sp. TaxID=1968902 RepID=UPI002FC6F997
MIKVREVGRFGFFEIEESEIWTPGATGLPYKRGTILIFDSFSEAVIGNEIAWASRDSDAQATVAGLIDGTQKVSLAFTVHSARAAELANSCATSDESDDPIVRPAPEESARMPANQNGRQLTKWE